MELSVQGKQINVGDALRAHVQEKLEDLNAKFFNRAIDATVIFSREGHAFFNAHVSIRIGKNINIVAEAEDTDIYAAFDQAAVKLAKQLRRYKNRLRDHHRRSEDMPDDSILQARSYTIAAEQDDEDAKESSGEQAPIIVAEMTTDILTLSVSTAVMHMDLMHQNALLFRNESHGGLNMVYRRPDGHVGWVDPVGNGLSAHKEAAE
jgi:ribosomal subunit interface protein